MKSFLKEIEQKFVELESSDYCDVCNRPGDQCVCNEEEIDEQNVTAAVAGFNTPAAFRKNVKKVDYASGVEESVNTPASFKWKETGHQRPESNEETSQDKFPFATDLEKWPNRDQEYPVKFTNQPYGTANIKDRSKKIEDILEQKYEQLIEGYRDFKSGDEKPSKKIKSTIREIAKKLQEIETLVQYNTKLKTEAGVTSSAYGPSTINALSKISERLIKISERIRSLGE